MHDNYDLRQEQLNKSSLLSSKKFLEALLQKFEERVVSLAETLASTSNEIPFFFSIPLYVTCFCFKLKSFLQ